jgi:F0F1-type ATP synthase membrane subunit b/b'
MADPDGLKELGGAASAFIGMMGTAVVALASAVGFQWKQANKVYGYRLKERDDLRDALNAATKSQEAATRSAEERNRVTQELAEAMRELANSIENLQQRLAMQHEHARDQSREQARSIDDNVKAIGGLADALRVNTGVVTDIRNHLSKHGVI